MAEDREHLQINKEPLHNPRRSGQPPRFIKRGDLVKHGRKLADSLASASATVKQQQSARPGHYLLKLKYEETLSFQHLPAHGIEFVSQEDKQVCVVFTSEQGLATFADHVQRLGLDDQNITHKQLLQALSSIEAWRPEDRTSWAIRQHGFPDADTFVLDVELWPLDAAEAPARKAILAAFEQWLASHQLQVLDKVNLDSFLLFRLRANAQQAQLLLSHLDVRMVDLPPVSGIDYTLINRDIADIPSDITSPPAQAPKVCILDSGINTNHPLIKPAMAESASFVEGEDASDLAGHGTQVAGIALYGNVAECNAANYWSPPFWLYNGKILDKNAEFNQATMASTLIKSVAYFVALGCRIFNLSVGNENAPYDGKHIRGMAYVLDMLSREHDILFIVSVGNFRGSDDPPIPEQSWRDEYPDYLLGEHSALIDPAPALNALTVGSLALHDATRSHQQRPEEIDHLAAAKAHQPSPFTRHGPSIKGAIKPELVAYGGNVASPMRFEGKQWQRREREPGVLSLNAQFIGHTVFAECQGSSFSAPYITHLAGRLLSYYPDASANRLRAMLVGQASIPQACIDTFDHTVSKHYAKTHGRRTPALDLAGYGQVQAENLYRSDETAVVLMAEETIKNDSHQFFELPLPEEFFRSRRATRTLRVALAHTPAVRTTRIDYKATKLVFNLIRAKSLEEVQKHFHKEMQKEHPKLGDSVSSKTNRHISSELRGKGTAQCSQWTFKQLKPGNKWYVVVTRQDAFGWGSAVSLEEEPYALVVTVTDRENEDARLYSQIVEKLKVKQTVRA